MRRRVLAFCSALIAFATSSGLSLAVEGPRADLSGRPMVDIILASRNQGSNGALMATLRRSLERLDANVSFDERAAMSPREVADAAKPASVAVTVWIDLGSPNVATVYVTEGKNVFARRLDLDRALDSVALDLLDVVVTSSVETVLSGRPLGVTREEFSRSLEQAPLAPAPAGPPTPPAAPPPSSPSHVVFAAAAFYEAALVAPMTAIDGPGLRIDGSRDGFWLGLSLNSHRRYDVTSAGATVRFAPEGFRLSFGRVFTLRHKLALIVGCGAGVDVTRIESVSTRAGLVPASVFWTTDIVARPTAEIQYRLGRLALGAMLGLDANLVQSVYAISTAPGNRPFWTPWRLHPVLALIVELSL